MKKIIYIVLVSLTSAFSITSCNEENEVKPITNSTRPGGGGYSRD